VVRRHEDGKLDILTLGKRRFVLNSIHSRRSFLEGAVEFFDDVDLRSTAPRVARAAIASHRELLRLSGAAEEPADLDHPHLSFQLAQISTDLDFRQTLLETRSEAGRMDLVAEHLALLVRQRSAGQAMKHVARSNGHGKHWPDLAKPE
jgi:Lon protease-like protein